MRTVKKAASSAWIVGAIISCSLFLGQFSPLAGQQWPHENVQFNKATTKPAEKGRHESSIKDPAKAFLSAPSATAWRAEDIDVPQATAHKQGPDKGFYEFTADSIPASREIKPVKPKMASEDSNTETDEKVGTEEKRVESKHVAMVSKSSPHYRIAIGDRLTVSIYGEMNTEREVVVDSTGSITYPIVGTLEVLGKTIDETRKAMNDRIRKVYRYTFVTISPIEFGAQYYTILGSVGAPGKKPLFGRETVLSALCRAGGFPMGLFRAQTVDLADLDHAFLMRKGDYLPVNFRSLVVEGDTSQDVELQAGDYIYIPSSLEKEIFVMGEVQMPAALGYINKVTLMEAIALAGGTTFNASSRAVVVRGSLSEPYTFFIDINLIFKGMACDFLLKPGDIVYVPPRQFTKLREVVNYAVRIFVSTMASDAGSVSWASITGTSPTENLNIIPNSPVSPVVPYTPIGP